MYPGVQGLEGIEHSPIELVAHTLALHASPTELVAHTLALHTSPTELVAHTLAPHASPTELVARTLAPHAKAKCILGSRDCTQYCRRLSESLNGGERAAGWGRFPANRNVTCSKQIQTNQSTSQGAGQSGVGHCVDQILEWWRVAGWGRFPANRNKHTLTRYQCQTQKKKGGGYIRPTGVRPVAGLSRMAGSERPGEICSQETDTNTCFVSAKSTQTWGCYTQRRWASSRSLTDDRVLGRVASG